MHIKFKYIALKHYDILQNYFIKISIKFAKKKNLFLKQ